MKTAVPKARPFSGRSSGLPEPEKPQEMYVYHWGRIFAAVFLLLLLVGSIIWGAFEIFGSGEQNEAVVAHQDGEAPPVTSVSADPPVSAEPLPKTASQEKPEPGASAGMPDQSESVQAEADLAGMPVSLPESSSGTASSESSEEPAPSQLASQESEPAPSAESSSLPATNAGASSPGEEGAASMDIRSDHVIRAQLTTGLEKKEPIDDIPKALTMNSDGLIRIYLFTEIQGMEDQRFFHDWYLDDERVARVTIKPFLDPMRASSAKYIDRHMVGDWRVDVITEDGDILATGAFSVLPQ